MAVARPPCPSLDVSRSRDRMVPKGKRKSATFCLGLTLTLMCCFAQTTHCFRLKEAEKREERQEADAAKSIGFREGEIVFGRAFEKGSGIESHGLDATGSSPSNASAEDDASYQADVPGWSKGEAHDVGSKEAPWRRMATSLQCGADQFKFRAVGTGASHFVVEQGNAHLMPLSLVPSSCGYSMQRNSLFLLMTVPFDGCNVVQEGGSYVLPMHWRGIPVSLLCPKPPAYSPTTIAPTTTTTKKPEMPLFPPYPIFPPWFPHFHQPPPVTTTAPTQTDAVTTTTAAAAKPQMPQFPPYPIFPPWFPHFHQPPPVTTTAPTQTDAVTTTTAAAAKPQMPQFPPYPIFPPWFPHFHQPPPVTTAAPTQTDAPTTAAKPQMPQFPPYPVFPPWFPHFHQPPPVTTVAPTQTAAPTTTAKPQMPQFPPYPIFPPWYPHFHQLYPIVTAAPTSAPITLPETAKPMADPHFGKYWPFAQFPYVPHPYSIFHPAGPHFRQHPNSKPETTTTQTPTTTAIGRDVPVPQSPSDYRYPLPPYGYFPLKWM